MYHTLEHIGQPLSLLGEAHRILAEDGILVVGVPNFASLMARLMQTRWAGLLPDQHVWHFTPRTLAMMLEKAGFRSRESWGMPVIHHHPNLAKYLALRCITAIGSLLNLDENLIVIAAKQAG